MSNKNWSASDDDELLKSLISQREQSYALHTTDKHNRLVKLGDITVIGSKLRVSLTAAAEPYIGNAFGVPFSGLVNKTKELDVSALRLANALGLNINNDTLLKQKAGVFYKDADLNDVIELAKKHKTGVMISANDMEAERGITLINWSAVYASKNHADSYFEKQQRMDPAEPMYLRTNTHQLVAADVVVAANDGGSQALALMNQHATHQALTMEDITVARTELLLSKDGKRMMLLKQREGATPFSAAVTSSRDFQTLTRNLHHTGGFCSVDRLNTIINGTLDQSTDPSSKIMAMTHKKPMMQTDIAPVLLYQHISGIKANSGNEVGVLLDTLNNNRHMTIAHAFSTAPGDGTARRPSKESLAALPAFKAMAVQDPGAFSAAIAKALRIEEAVRENMQSLSRSGFVGNVHQNEKQSEATYDLSAGTMSKPFTNNDSVMQEFFKKRERMQTIER